MSSKFASGLLQAALGFAALMGASGHSASAQATIYNVQFATTAIADGGGNPVHYAGTGALGMGGTFFNFDEVATRPTSSTFPNQKDSNGATSTVGVTVTGLEFYNATHGTPDASSPAALLGSYSDTKNGVPGTFTLYNLPPNTAYKIYLYALNGHFYNPFPTKTTFVIGSASATTDGTAESPFSAGHDYVVLAGTTSAAGVVAGAYLGTNGDEGDFNALQIVLGGPA